MPVLTISLLFQKTGFAHTFAHLVSLQWVSPTIPGLPCLSSPGKMMSSKFYEDASLDNDWVEIAIREVNEPESEEIIAEKLEQLRTLITGKFVEQVDEKLLSEGNLTRHLRSSNWDPAGALSVFLASVQLVRDFPRFLLPLDKSRETSTSCLVWAAPGRDQHGSRVVFLRLGPWEPSKISVESFYSFEFSLFQLISMEPRTQVGGVVIVVDLTDFGFRHLRALGIEELRCLGNFLSGGFPLSFRAIHFVNNPWVFNKLFTLLKPFLNDQIIKAITFHGHNTNDLVNDISPDLLPEKLGGTCDENKVKAASSECLADLENLEADVEEARDLLVAVSKIKQKS